MNKPKVPDEKQSLPYACISSAKFTSYRTRRFRWKTLVSFDIVSIRDRSTSSDVWDWVNEEVDGEVDAVDGEATERLREDKVLM